MCLNLCVSETDGAEDDNNGFEEEKKEEKIVTATKKGAAVLDQWIPDHIKSQYHVLQMVLNPSLHLIVSLNVVETGIDLRFVLNVVG